MGQKLFSRSVKDLEILPATSAGNVFIDNFTKCFVDNGFNVSEFELAKLPNSKTVIIHWPHHYFVYKGRQILLQSIRDIVLMRLGRALFGIQYIWVAHNAEPHDREKPPAWLWAAFLNSLSGIIFLSRISQDIIIRTYHIPSHIKFLQTVHGHYLDNMLTPPHPTEIVQSEIRLVNFGQIRPYKNVDALVKIIAGMTGRGLNLTVAGACYDKDLQHYLEKLALGSPNITLDFCADNIPQADLEQYVDSAHGVVLPYRRILNSGSVFFALSRNRPVLAPRAGSLPEIQEYVGEDWLYLYDGDLTEAVVERFAERLRLREPTAICDLSRFGWADIANDLTKFVLELHV